MSRNKILGSVGGLAVLAVIAIVLFFTVLRDDAPEEFELRSADELAETDDAQDSNGGAEQEDTDEERADENSSDAETEASDPTADVAGSWTVGPESAAGYRVVEDFVGGIQDFEAVGRTNTIDGFLTIDGTTVTEASFEVDVASIASDSGTRDNQFTGRIMNVAEFPTAKFVLTSPIELGDIPAEATPISTTATGELTLRGVTQPVDVAIDAQIVAGEIEVVGNIAVLFSDFEIDNPSNPAVEVRDEGTVEFQLIFVR